MLLQFRLMVRMKSSSRRPFKPALSYLPNFNHNHTTTELTNNKFILVFTKSVNSNFCAFWLAPVTCNILGYSLLCDWSQDGVLFWGIFERRNLSNKWSSQKNKYQESDKLWFAVVYWYIIGRMLNLQQKLKLKMHLTKSLKCLYVVNRLPTKRHFYVTKSYFLSFLSNRLGEY